MLGKVIGNYKLTTEIGRGPYGVVYRALDQGRGREVALKSIFTSFTEQVEVSERLRSLAPTIAQFRHPQLAEFYTTLQHGADRYLVTELIEGETLSATLQHNGVLSPEDAGKLIAQICTPLAWLHQAGWAHGDLKPSNILLGADGVPKITDLGLAYALAEQAVHTSASGLAYRAPEQLSEVGFDARSDVYALGAMLYELVTGLLPFRRINDAALWQAHLHEDVPSPRNYFPLIPAPLEDILLIALAKRPADRFASPMELQSVLFDWLGMPVTPSQSNGNSDAAPAKFSVITQRAPEEMEIPTLEPTDSQLLAEDARTIPELPVIELSVPDTASFEDDGKRRVTKPIGAGEPERKTQPQESDSGRLRRETELTRVPAPVPTPAPASTPTPTNNSTSPLYDEVVVDLDEATRRRSRWKPWLAVAGLAAAVGIPYAMMQNEDNSSPNLPARSTLSVPSPTATPQPSSTVAVAPTIAAPVANAKKVPTPHTVPSPKATPKATPKVTPTSIPAPTKRATPMPTPTAKPLIRATPTPTPSLTKKSGKAAATPYPEPTPKVKEKKKGGIGGFFKEILTGKEKEKEKKKKY